MIDFIASQRHWLDHLAPVWLALPEEVRGSFWVGQLDVARAARLGVEAKRAKIHERYLAPVVVVAAETDRRRAGRRKVIRFEHGVGFSFHGDRRRGTFAPSSYAGGTDQHNVVAFLNPNHYANDLWARAYPRVPCQIVGTPKLDDWHQKRKPARNDPPVVAVSFHWDCLIVAETRWAFPHYAEVLPAFARRRDLQVVMHSHPRSEEAIRRWAAQHRVEYIATFDEVLERADVYVNDSSSTLYEFASTDRPVVTLNAPWFRKNVQHGLRFWEHADVGIQFDDPLTLSAAVDRALEDPPAQQALRRAATADCYPHRGRAARTAAAAILEIVEKTQRVKPRRADPPTAVVPIGGAPAVPPGESRVVIR